MYGKKSKLGISLLVGWELLFASEGVSWQRPHQRLFVMAVIDIHTAETQTHATDKNVAVNNSNIHTNSEDKKLDCTHVSNDDAEDNYDEEEDEDFTLESTKREDLSDAEDDEDDYMDAEDKRDMSKFSSIESIEGGLIKTRRQRQEEEKERKQKKNANVTESRSTADINSIWEELRGAKSASPAVQQELSTSISTLSKPSSNNTAEKIKITRTYEFAGKQITEEKEVDINSEEAKAHQNSVKIKSTEETKHPITSPVPGLRRKRKRASLLDAVISNSSNTKLSTLEKSRLDWATYVDKNKISDELKYKNKGGFLEKQDFLDRVDSKRDNLYKEAKSKHN